MSQNLYTYLQKLHLFVEKQKRRIDELEDCVRMLTDDISELKERPPVTVGTIEYNFDQLKVETLDGALNIGLNPSDLGGIENFDVHPQDDTSPYSPKEQMETTMNLENSIYQYLDSNLRTLVQKYEEQLNIKVDDFYIEFIKEDIKKQLPTRIDHYFKLSPIKEGNYEIRKQLQDQIEQRIIQDIEEAVLHFLKNLPKQ